MVGTLWFAALTMALLQESNELRDPSFSYQINTAHYKNFQVCTYSPDLTAEIVDWYFVPFHLQSVIPEKREFDNFDK